MYRERDEEKRQLYLIELKKYLLEDLVYIDESGIEKSELKKYGWAPRNEILIGERSGKFHNRTTIIGGLNKSCQSCLAPFYFEGHTDTVIFLLWLEKCLLPVLKEGQVVIMDNASFHKSEKIKEMIESVGCKLLFLPPYSPDLNPIEIYWHWLKNKVKKLNMNNDNFYENLNNAMTSKYGR